MTRDGGVELQRAAFEDVYRTRDRARWSFHFTTDPLTRYLRDRRLKLGLKMLGDSNLAKRSILVVCGGVGGEGMFFRRAGVTDVTVTDISEEALSLCSEFDPSLKTKALNAEAMELPDASYDVVVVQDGLHHLPRPVLGLTEMLRVSRRGVIVIEPHRGLVARLLGTTWEREGDGAVNYVFRWDGDLLEQVTRSYLLSKDATVTVKRIWDHGGIVARVASRLPKPLQLPVAKAIYGTLNIASIAGNMMVAVVVKDEGLAPNGPA
jgi:ubiquinone/menaquinone biosynthesis C-methylase UbiE